MSRSTGRTSPGGSSTTSAKRSTRAHLASDGHFSRRCEDWLAARIGCRTGAVDALLHRRARDGRAARRHRAWRRSHHAVVHVRLHGERLRAARRRARLRRHPARHAQHRRAVRSRRRITPRTRAIVAGALRGRGLRDGRACMAIARAPRAARDRRRRTGAGLDLSGHSARAVSARSPPPAFTRPRTSFRGEGGAL